MSGRDILKIAEKFGANGIIILMIWGLLATLNVVGKIPADAGTTKMEYRTLLQLVIGTMSAATGLIFFSWNLLGVPKRLGTFETNTKP